MPPKKKINMIKSHQRAPSDRDGGTTRQKQKQKQSVNIKINIGDKVKKPRRTNRRKTTPSDQQPQRSINPISIAVNASVPPMNYNNPYNDMVKQHEQFLNNQENIFRLYQNQGLVPSRQVTGLMSQNVGSQEALGRMTTPPDIDTSFVNEVITPNPFTDIGKSVSQRLPVGIFDPEDMGSRGDESSLNLAHEVAGTKFVSNTENKFKNSLAELLGKFSKSDAIPDDLPELEPVAGNKLSQDEVTRPPRINLLSEIQSKRKEMEDKKTDTDIPDNKDRPPPLPNLLSAIQAKKKEIEDNKSDPNRKHDKKEIPPPKPNLMDELKAKQLKRASENKEPVTEIERPPVDVDSEFKKELLEASNDVKAVMEKFKKYYKDGSPAELKRDLQRLQRIAGANKNQDTMITNKEDLDTYNKISLATGAKRSTPKVKYQTVINKLNDEKFKKKLDIILGESEALQPEAEEKQPNVFGYPEEKSGPNIVTLSDVVFNR